MRGARAPWQLLGPPSASLVLRGRCERGYTGARCERVDLFYLRGDQGQIVIISLIAAIVTLIILIVGICLCSQYVGERGRKGREAGRQKSGKGKKRVGKEGKGRERKEGANPAQLHWLLAGSVWAAPGWWDMVLQLLGGAWDIPLGLETRCDPIWIFYTVKAEGEGGASLPCLILPLFFFACLFFIIFPPCQATVGGSVGRERQKRWRH